MATPRKKNPQKAGRPKIKITKAMCAKAKKCASQGLTKDQIASVLGISESTLYERIKEYPEFSEAIREGRASGIEQITNALFKKAKSGDVGAIKYYLNNRDNEHWKDRHEHKVELEDVMLTPDARKKRLTELLSKCAKG